MHRYINSQLPALSGFLQRLSWLALADQFGRLSRIFTVVAMARTLDADGFAVVALSAALFEIARSLTQTGLGASIVHCDADALAPTNTAAQRLNWACAFAVGAGTTPGVMKTPSVTGISFW